METKVETVQVGSKRMSRIESQEQGKVQIRPALNEQEERQIQELRYQVYMLERGCYEKHADHEKQIISEPIDQESLVLGAFLEGKCVGTIRLTPSECAPKEYREFYRLDEFEASSPGEVCIVTKLMVTNEWRGTLLGVELCKEIYKYAIRAGFQVGVIDANEHLVRLYKRLGFIPVSNECEAHPVYGKVCVMAINTFDINYLSEVRSPFVPTLQVELARRDSIKASEQNIAINIPA